MIVFPHRGAFWGGICAVTLGVLLHLPMYVQARGMDYMMAGMPVDGPMKLGMALILAGLGLTAYGLLPRGGMGPDRQARARVRALDEAPIRRSHVMLLVVMAAAVTIDVMKPTTLGFVLPGMTREYGLRSPLNPAGHLPVAWLPLVALTGMVLGSIIWGALGDRIGRRASILLAGVMFIGTSICGAMPGFVWNLLMCFLMGAAVGGMLPTAFALLAETIPARHRSWLMLLIGLPTGVLFVLLNRWIPESPRFLLSTGRVAEAESIMKRFGARLVPEDDDRPAAAQTQGRFGQLFRQPLAGLTTGVALFGIGWGLVNNGFLLWLPTNLRNLGLDVAASDRLLADSALIGLPAVVAVALLYGFWSSRRTMIICAGVNAATLAAFALLGNRVGDHPALLRVLVVLLLISTGAILATLTPYSSEVYPTRIRARGTGLAGMCARAGGLLGVGIVVAGIAPPSLTGAALLGVVPVTLAAVAVGRYGVETRRRPLEEITAAEIAA